MNTTIQAPPARQMVLAPVSVSAEKRAVFKAAEINGNAVASMPTVLAAGIQDLFIDRHEERRIEQARRLMGEAVSQLSDPELESYLVKFQYLLDSWFDDFERTLFDNKTLTQLLKEE